MDEVNFPRWVNIAINCARPAITYACGLAVAIGVFVPWTTFDKMGVAASVAGGVSWLRSNDKKVEANAALSSQGGK